MVWYEQAEKGTFIAGFSTILFFSKKNYKVRKVGFLALNVILSRLIFLEFNKDENICYLFFLDHLG